MSTRRTSAQLRAAFAVLALMCLGACAHHDNASSDAQNDPAAAPSATALTPSTNETSVIASSESSSPLPQPTDQSGAAVSSEASSPLPETTDEPGAAASSDPSRPAVSQSYHAAAAGVAQASTSAGSDSPAGAGSPAATASPSSATLPLATDVPEGTASPTAASSARAGDEPQCITLEADSYCKVWSNDDDLRTQTEYVRSGETVDAWKRMITVVRYKQLGSLAQIMPTYMKVIAPDLYPKGAQPVFIKPESPQHKEEIATRFILSGTNDSNNEYVVAYFRADAAPPAYALVFSQHIVAGMDTPSTTLYHSWINDLRAVNL